MNNFEPKKTFKIIAKNTTSQCFAINLKSIYRAVTFT